MTHAFTDIAGQDQASPRHRALAELLAARSLSRAQLARAAGLAPSTVTSLIRDLTEEGAVIELGPVEVRAGARRRSGPRGTALSINPSQVAAVGVDYGFRNVRVLVCDLFAKLLAIRDARLPENYSREDGLMTAASLVREAVQASGVPPGVIVGAGVALPGPIDTLEQRVVQSDILAGWGGTSADDFTHVLGIPALIENDANMAALGEHTWGAAKGHPITITVKFHSGIGAGLIVNHQLVTGTRGGAGEIGHTTIDPRGAVCRCGKRGCLDTFSSVPAILSALEPRRAGITVAELLDLLARGDAGAQRVVADAATLVGQAVGSRMSAHCAGQRDRRRRHGSSRRSRTRTNPRSSERGGDPSGWARSGRRSRSPRRQAHSARRRRACIAPSRLASPPKHAPCARRRPNRGLPARRAHCSLGTAGGSLRVIDGYAKCDSSKRLATRP